MKKKVRQKRVRAVISGTKKRPRLCVHRSLTGLYLQLIDDSEGKTIVAVDSKKIDIKKADTGDKKGKVAIAFVAGKKLGELALEKNIKEIVFDRAGNRYHGRIKAVADGAREVGLKF